MTNLFRPFHRRKMSEKRSDGLNNATSNGNSRANAATRRAPNPSSSSSLSRVDETTWQDESPMADLSVTVPRPTLTPCQHLALEKVEAQARVEHEQQLPVLLTRMKRFKECEGITAHQLLKYMLEDVPIIIHVSASTIKKLAMDSHYRSLFETNTSGGSNCVANRKIWEHSMFDGAYSAGPDFERPKYGCLQLLEHPAGDPIVASMKYGNCFLTLASNTRERVSWYFEDTSRDFRVKKKGEPTIASPSLGTLEHCAHIVNRFSDRELQLIGYHLRQRNKKDYKPQSMSRLKTYKEVQIHGPVRLDRDVAMLTLGCPRADADCELVAAVGRLQKKSDCCVVWQGD